MRTEDERAGRLLAAQASAVALFDEVGARGIILEIHLTDTARGFGGFYEQLLDLG